MPNTQASADDTPQTATTRAQGPSWRLIEHVLLIQLVIVVFVCGYAIHQGRLRPVAAVLGGLFLLAELWFVRRQRRDVSAISRP